MKSYRLSEFLVSKHSVVKTHALNEEKQLVLLEDIEKNTGLIQTSLSVGQRTVLSPKLDYEAGDILFGKLRPTLRKCAVALSSGYCSGDILVLRPQIDQTAYFLAAVLRSESNQVQIARFVAGSNLPRIRVEDLLSISFDAPEDLHEIKKLNEAFLKIHESRVALKETQAVLERISKSIFY